MLTYVMLIPEPSGPTPIANTLCTVAASDSMKMAAESGRLSRIAPTGHVIAKPVWGLV